MKFSAIVATLLLSPVLALAQPPRGGPGGPERGPGGPGGPERGSNPGPRLVAETAERMHKLEEENAALKKKLEELERALRQNRESARPDGPPRPPEQPRAVERRPENRPGAGDSRRPDAPLPRDAGGPRPGAGGFGPGRGFGPPPGFGPPGFRGESRDTREPGRPVAGAGGLTRGPQGPNFEELMKRLDRIEQELNNLKRVVGRDR